MNASTKGENNSCNCSFSNIRKKRLETQYKYSFIQMNLFRVHFKIHPHRLLKREQRPSQQLGFFFLMLCTNKNFQVTSSCLTEEILKINLHKGTVTSSIIQRLPHIVASSNHSTVHSKLFKFLLFFCCSFFSFHSV